MCLAPRYISGMMARPFSPCRKTASLPDTPCASSAADMTSTATTIKANLLARIACMAVVTRGIEIAARLDDLVLVLCRGGGHRLLSLLHHVVGHLYPVALVDGTASHQHQVARLDDRSPGASDFLPVLIGLRRNLLDTLRRRLRADRFVDDVSCRVGDADHDLLD